MSIPKKAIVLLTALIVTACSSGDKTPVGTEFMEDGTLGSKPGELYGDTIPAAKGGVSFNVMSLLSRNTFLTLGRKDDYKTYALLRIDFSDAAKDSDKIVTDAYLRLRFIDQQSTDVLGARFYKLDSLFSESDTITSLSYSTPILDKTLTNVDREIKLLGEYSLPPALVQGWIRGDSTHNGIVIVPSDTTVSTQVTFGSRENTDSDVHAFLEVSFLGGYSSNYPIADDATFVESLAQTSNLIISDGYVRRIHIPLDLRTVPQDAIIHRALLVLKPVPGSAIGNDFNVKLYAPSDSLVGSSGILSGRTVARSKVNVDSESFEVSVRSILLSFLSGKVANNGFILQFDNEGSQIRQVEFYSSAAESSLVPVLRLTYSSPPNFGD